MGKDDNNYDAIVIGGGITGAGVFREAVRMGLKTLLLEKMDFAWGTSSRSSKMVHGGLRYLQQGKVFLTRTSVKERERLMKEASGLVEPMEILMPVYDDHSPGKVALDLGLSIYGLMANEKQHTFFDADEFLEMVPSINPEQLVGGFRFFDAQTDDARLVLRLINEAIKNGGDAYNYTEVVEILRDNKGSVEGVAARTKDTGETAEYHSRAVINATGVWAELFHPSPHEDLHLRPLRGSHLIFPTSVIPITRTITFFNRTDNRAVFVFPWKGRVLLGTTDIDHNKDIAFEPSISREEVDYLIDGLKSAFPRLDVSSDDAICSIAGVRPVLSRGDKDPSKESRENVVWVDNGLVTVTGGKLTTFRVMARDALKAAKPFISANYISGSDARVFEKVPSEPITDFHLSLSTWRRLYGRYGMAANEVVSKAAPKDLTKIPETDIIWAEVAHAARCEQVRHLSDLLLRRVRMGLLIPEGGKKHLQRIREICEPILPWSKEQWENELTSYIELWEKAYAVPK